MVEMDLQSLHFQQYCAMCVTEGGGGMKFHAVCFCDLELDPMTLIDRLDVNTQDELIKVRASRTDRQTDTQTDATECRIREWVTS